MGNKQNKTDRDTDKWYKLKPVLGISYDIMSIGSSIWYIAQDKLQEYDISSNEIIATHDCPGATPLIFCKQEHNIYILNNALMQIFNTIHKQLSSV